jgi:hypothetical protein
LGHHRQMDGVYGTTVGLVGVKGTTPPRPRTRRDGRHRRPAPPTAHRTRRSLRGRPATPARRMLVRYRTLVWNRGKQATHPRVCSSQVITVTATSSSTASRRRRSRSASSPVPHCNCPTPLEISPTSGNQGSIGHILHELHSSPRKVTTHRTVPDRPKP